MSLREKREEYRAGLALVKDFRGIPAPILYSGAHRGLLYNLDQSLDLNQQALQTAAKHASVLPGSLPRGPMVSR